MRGLALRLNAATKFAAVIGVPVWKRYPRLSWIVATLPPRDSFGYPFATSGVTIVPAAPGLSG